MNRASVERTPTLHAPPRFLLWLAVGVFVLLLLGAAAGLTYFSSGQRLSSLIPFAGLAVIVVVVGLVGGAFLFRKSLPRLLWLWLLIAMIILTAIAGIAGVQLYRTALPPRYQEQVLTEVPFMSGFLRSLLPPTPVGGALPTVAAPAGGGLSPDDLLGGSLSLATSTPEGEATPEVTEQAVEEIIVLAPTATFTPEPTAVPPTATPEPTEAALPDPTAVPAEAEAEVALVSDSSPSRASQARMFGFTHVQQDWNNCGPANATMVLSYYAWGGDQDIAASYLKPNDEDKNVSPSEIVGFINEQTGVRAVTRIGGDMELLKQFIFNNIPIIIETAYMPEGYDWIGHYQTVVGYDDNAGVFYLYDSYLGTGVAGEGLAEPYAEFDENWKAFNRVFIAVYEPSREWLVQQILGERADLTRAAEIALETAQEEARANRQDKFAWFNIGTAYTRLGQYEEAARAFDYALQLNLPFRMLWYQFGPFEAYFNVGRYDNVLALVNNNLTNGGQYVEETYYWQGRVFAAQGRTADATSAFRRALDRNPLYAAAQQALNSL